MDAKRLSDEELLQELQLRFNENNKLCIELSMLLSQLKDVNKRLEDSEKIKSNFLSNIRNEIINPFTAILGLAKGIEQTGLANWHKAREMASMIYSEAFSLDFQLKNIFAAADIEAGDAHLEIVPIDVWELIEEVVESLSHELEAKQLQVVYFDNDETSNRILHFKTDPVKVKLVISNLLNNAITYSHTHNNIVIKAEKKGKTVKVSFQDFGIGIDKVLQAQIFDRFKQLQDGPTKPFKGHGLGLCVVRGLMDILGGEVELSHSDSQGSTFSIYLTEQDNLHSSNLLTGTEEFLFHQAGEGEVL